MNEHTNDMIPHRSWFSPNSRREVDKKGVIGALAFLVAIGVLAGGSGDKTGENIRWQKQPVLSVQVDVRQPAKATFGENKAVPPQFTTPRREGADLRRGPIDTLTRDPR